MSFKSQTQPLCRYCGERIRKHAITVKLERECTANHHPYEGWSRYAYTAEPVKSKAECQKLTNQTVLAVKWERAQELTTAGFEPRPERDHIVSFSEWDGESYVDPFFCNGDHAKRFAYVMARAGHQTQASADAHRSPKQEVA